MTPRCARRARRSSRGRSRPRARRASPRGLRAARARAGRGRRGGARCARDPRSLRVLEATPASLAGFAESREETAPRGGARLVKEGRNPRPYRFVVWSTGGKRARRATRFKLEPLSAEEHPPFALACARRRRRRRRRRKNEKEPRVDVDAAHLFDAAVLAEYVTRAKQFENPLNRVPMTPPEGCQRLDAPFGQVRSAMEVATCTCAFRDAAAERESRRVRAARELRNRGAAASAHRAAPVRAAASMFMDLRARRAREAATRASGAERRRLRAGAIVTETEETRRRTETRASRGRR